MIEIITERDRWNRFMELVGNVDFYYSYYYHFLSKKENEVPTLVAYKEKDLAVALPILVRKIEGTEFSDATSVYGYAGPVCASKEDPKEVDTSEFKRQLQTFLLDNKIVSVFSRLHPYIDYQENILRDIGTITSPGEVVNIDLTLPLDIQRQQYNSRLKTYVNKARRAYTVIEGRDEGQIEEFIEMYYENMRRVDADPYYFFDKRYFYQLMISSFFKVDLLLCKANDTGELIGGAMFIKTGEIVQYHLSGCKQKYLPLNPIKLLIDEMRLRATEEEFTYFNLGGGLGVKHDSLFRFKSSFSKDLKPAQFWKYIVNRDMYAALTARTNDTIGEPEPEDANFFPAYRRTPKTAKTDI